MHYSACCTEMPAEKLHYNAVFVSETTIMLTHSPLQVAPQPPNLASSGMTIPKYIPQFDGLRGIAIFVVLLAHLSYLGPIGFVHIFQYGRTGVDLFFVLSGFLITGILLDTKDLPGYFKNFYARSALRIWPLYYGILFLFFVLFPLLFPQHLFLTERHYLALLRHLHSKPLLSISVIPSRSAPTWSLAVEEQYYMFWAPVVFLCDRKSLAEYSARHDRVFILFPHRQLLPRRPDRFRSQFHFVPPGTARRRRSRCSVAAL